MVILVVSFLALFSAAFCLGFVAGVMWATWAEERRRV